MHSVTYSYHEQKWAVLEASTSQMSQWVSFSKRFNFIHKANDGYDKKNIIRQIWSI